MHVFNGIEELIASRGTDLGSSDWMTIDQERIDRFAEATGDDQWIHVDPKRAADGPFGATIAHGYLTLSMLPELLGGLFRVEGVSMAINYGLDRVRFLSPVVVGSRIRVSANVESVTELDGAAQAVYASTVDLEGSERPAAAVTSIVRYLA